MRRILLLICVVCLTGCFASSQGELSPETAYQRAEDAVQAKQYHEALDYYGKIVSQSPSSPLAADALYEMAVIHTLRDNSHRDFAQALRLFEDFVKKHPDHLKYREAQAWVYVLKYTLDLRRENEVLKKNIEQLKRLDIRHEERRKER